MLRLLMLIYRPVFAVLLVIDTLILSFAVIIVSFFDPGGNKVHYIGKFWSRFNMALSGVRVRLSGFDNIIPGHSYILMSNHQSLIDVWTLIGYIPLQLRWVIKRELRDIPAFGLGCERMGHIFIDRHNSSKSHKELEAVRERFDSGASVVFFPEGTRSPDGCLLPFKKGGFVMSLQYGVPVLPVTINGSKDVLPRKSLRLMPGIIDVIIHPPVDPGGYSMDKKELLMDRVKDVIESGRAKALSSRS